jgi:hypothetical protein
MTIHVNVFFHAAKRPLTGAALCHCMFAMIAKITPCHRSISPLFDKSTISRRGEPAAVITREE